MTSKDPSISLPNPGLEIVPFAALTRVPLPPLFPKFPKLTTLGESLLGPLLIYMCYQSLLTYLRTDSNVRRGEFARRDQFKLILKSLSQSFDAPNRSTLQACVLFSVMRLILPSLGLPLGIWGFLSILRVCEKSFNSYWDGLNYGQQAELKRSVFASAMNLRYRLEGYDLLVEK
ncbi:MAG: hypothetical protein ACKN89_12255 [Cyanobium sp.]